MIEQKNILLSEIKPDPNQPRKYYDDVAMQELTDSVKSKGILQPILIRPNGKGYILVCGERRFKAATAAGLTLIPAVIREMTPEEALELQIIENLQRKDVHPMEEAVAFKSLIDKKQTAEEIAVRVGKSPFYVRQRMKLNAMTSKWQEAFYHNRMTATLALKIAFFDTMVQDKLYKSYGGQSGKIDINEWNLRDYRGDLSIAPFPLDDASIDKKAGACNSCPFNTATAKLFSDNEASPRCTNVQCYSNKCGSYFNTELEKALLDPAMIFVSELYSSSSSDKFINRVEKAGFEVHLKNNWDTPYKPDAPDFEDWVEDNDDVEGLSDSDIRALFEKEEGNSYAKDLKEYNDKIAGGKYKKAFMLTGNEKGGYVYVTIKKSSSSSSGSSKATKEKAAEGKLTAKDIDEEIARIKDREKRAKELDQEKVMTRIIEAVKEDKTFKTVPKSKHPMDVVLVRFLLENHITFQNRDILKKHLGLEGVWGSGNPEKLYDKLAAMSDAQVTFLVWQIMLEKHANENPRHNSGFFFRKMAESLGTIPIEAFETEQKEAADKRQVRVKKRIEELQEKKKELATKKAVVKSKK